MSAENKQTIEEKLEAIEAIIEGLEGNDLSLADALKEFEKGIALVRSTQEEISDVEKKLQVLTENGEIHEF